MTDFRLAVIGGGSGGHLFPAVSAVQELFRLRQDSSVLFLTSRRDIDAKVLRSVKWQREVEQSRVRVEPYVGVPGRSGALVRLAMLPGASRAYLRAHAALKKFQPHIVIGCGAMASLSGVLAARRLKIPILLMEQNALPGQAIRMLARVADATQTGLPLLPRFAKNWPNPIHVTGTPIRSAIAELYQASTVEGSPSQHRPKLLILGGSQGSHTVNRLTLEALKDEHCVPSDWQIVHQTGESQVAEVSAEYARRGRSATVLSFLNDLPVQLATTTVAISRAGAGTLQELACAGLPSILIPFSRAANDHQKCNASILAECGAAVMIDETSTDPGLQLRQQLNDLIRQPGIRIRLREGIRKFAHPEAALKTAQLALDLSEQTAR